MNLVDKYRVWRYLKRWPHDSLKRTVKARACWWCWYKPAKYIRERRYYMCKECKASYDENMREWKKRVYDE